VIRLGYRIVQLTAQMIFRICRGVKVVGLENVPRAGRVILACNHRSNFDPPLVGSLTPREVHFFAKEELFKHRISGGFLKYLNAFPVRRGQFDREALTKCLDILKQEDALVFFPEGTRAPADGFLKAKLGIGWVECLSEAIVVPVYMHGSRTLRFTFRVKPQISITYGKPISYNDLIANSDLRGKELYQLVSDRILEAIRDLSLLTPYHRVAERGKIYDRDSIANERLR
jgi:1-acyl-sn-glycerol-3-phosphate acyltransferase